jgi:hypothetical protein
MALLDGGIRPGGDAGPTIALKMSHKAPIRGMDGPRIEAHDVVPAGDKGKSSVDVILGRTTGKL